MKPAHTIKNITVLGGGTAGLVAALILKRSNPYLEITVVESKELGIIGVGEGSTEHWTAFMKFCELDMPEMLRETDATVKVGIRFDNWNGDDKGYFHSLVYPYDSSFINSVASFYTYAVANDIDNSRMLPDTFTKSRFLIDRVITNQYHFDTFKLNKWLHKQCEIRNITFKDNLIRDVVLDENGYVKQLVADTGETFDADFYIDASGFNKIIIGKLGATWHDQSRYLPMNHAIAFPTDYTEDINAFTTSTALSAGWLWDIPTYQRHGNGYVFCDNYSTVEDAIKEVEEHLGYSIEVARDIKFSAGYTDTPMIKNCVAVGLSAIFVEPLEASSIGATIQQSFLLSNMLHSYAEGDVLVEKQYNSLMLSMFKNIVDFIQIHYITKRDDTQFWRDKPFVLTDFNKETLENFKHTTPNKFFFETPYTMFRKHNWSMVMHGLGLFDIDSVKRLWLNQPKLAREEIHAEYNNLKNTEGNIITVSHREHLDFFRNIVNNVS